MGITHALLSAKIWQLSTLLKDMEPLHCPSLSLPLPEPQLHSRLCLSGMVLECILQQPIKRPTHEKLVASSKATDDGMIDTRPYCWWLYFL